MARKPTVQGLIKKLKARGSLDLYWVGIEHVGVRTLHWVDDKNVKVAYDRIYPALNTLPLYSFLRNLIGDDEAYPNYWLAYGAQLRRLAERERAIK